jgi:hypothetical protein
MYKELMIVNPCLRRTMVSILATICLMLSPSACAIRLVQPFDENLVNDAQALYKKGAEVIAAGQGVSPITDQERSSTVNPNQHPAHFSKFESKYDTLIIDCNALILRAMSNAQTIGKVGKEFQEKINVYIEASIPTLCPELKSQFKDVSLEAENFRDLKCLILRWREQHMKAENGILKKANWEGRHILLFNAIFAIEQAENFKKGDAKAELTTK